MPKPIIIESATVLHGDCVSLMPTLGMVDAIVTDPPYGLAFRGKDWDKLDGPQAWHETWARAAYASLKPSGYLLAFGGSRTHHRIWCAIEDAGFVLQDTIMWLYGQGFPKGRSQLKPAFEPICVAYKPGGKRSLQVEECRITTNENLNGGAYSAGGKIPEDVSSYFTGSKAGKFRQPPGRWPANVCHDGSDEVMQAFAAFGNGHARGNISPTKRLVKTSGWGNIGSGPDGPIDGGDAGTAARFFYCAKASKADRAGSKHPTVKPVALMRWLVKLVTPPGGLVLDPFAGSGTTGAAALIEGRQVILIEREAEYVSDTKRRLNALQRGIPVATKKAARPPQPQVMLDLF